MATIGNLRPNLIDWAKRVDPDGKVDTIVELLSEENPIIENAVVLEGNLPTGHRTTVRSGLPSVAWRMLNYGVQPSKSTTVQVTDACGMLEAYAEVDKKLADLNGNTAEFRLSEDRAFLEQMNQEMARAIFYGDGGEPVQIVGLTPRFNDKSAANGSQIVDAGGTGSDNTSIWFITWDPTTCHLIFPKGSKAGLEHKDLGEVTLQDANGGLYQGYRSHYKWEVGLVVRDWRYVARIANIDVSDLETAGEDSYTGPNLVNLMVKAYNKLKNPRMGRTFIYCNRTVKTAIDLIAQAKSNVHLTINDYAGQPTTHFWGIPIMVVDALLNTEERVV